MLKSFAITSIIVSAAWAQNSTSSASAASATASSAANPLIPAGISGTCSSFLTSLDTNPTLTTCLNALTSATSAFAPGSSSTPSSATVTAALNNLCTDSVKNACSETLLRPLITSFYTACPAELTTNSNSAVIALYDTLYTAIPMQNSVCSKDDSGNWCVMAPSTNTREVDEDASEGSTDLTQLLALLYTTDNSALKRRAETPAIVPNMTTYHDSNLPFLFFNPSQDATTLCTTCLRNVLTAYINFESDIPYAPGVDQSQLLDNQAPLYSAVQSKCPSGFLNGAVQAAGGLSSGGGLLSSGAVPTVSTGYQTIVAVAIGALTLAVSAF